MAKVFYAQRLPKETIAAIKRCAAAWGISESEAIERAFPSAPAAVKQAAPERPERSPIFRPSGKL